MFRRQRKRLVYGLNYARQPFICRYLGETVNWSSKYLTSNVVRFMPLARPATDSTWIGRILTCDERMVKMCSLYKEFQIRYIWFDLTVDTVSGFKNATYPGEANPNGAERTLIFARLIRDCNNGNSVSTADQILADPGTIQSRVRSGETYPRIRYKIKPVTYQERSQWIPCDNSAGNFTYWAMNHVYFAPAIDFCLYNPDGCYYAPNDTERVYQFSCTINVRYYIVFRNSASVLAPTKGSLTYQADAVAMARDGNELTDAALISKNLDDWRPVGEPLDTNGLPMLTLPMGNEDDSDDDDDEPPPPLRN